MHSFLYHFVKFRIKFKLTITTHSRRNTFFQPTILASIAINSQNVALLIFGTGPILDFLMNGSSEKSLKERNNDIIIR